MISIEKKIISATPRKLTANWTIIDEISLKDMKSTHNHRILNFSEYTNLYLVKRREGSKKWYEIKLHDNWWPNTKRKQTRDTLRRMYSERYKNNTVKFKTLSEAEQAYLLITLSLE